MLQPRSNTPFADEVPWSDRITAYEDHFTTYMRLLDVSADNATEEEMAHVIDPAREPERARNVLRSHLDRANWVVTSGYKDLFAS
ncbi:MAG: hypothetical protein E5Y63_24885 [Mesorhizobium sp.]|uniref:hypothetical protein n=1 Tax=Mesorhizobium sp. TaxID=1871066 RepID=UPI0012236725|nr:hypothetical protein [Mesorhizobium sp.]TIM27274.1 MAG: hypothetical protein E5Y63_24885 [Mesorhizobium sp.]TIO21543.1 MAG: hypothetical protein E5X83_29010 [Mesorhizobium sp.]